ncbi:MAG: VCBS repeat-containing protein [Gemmatimonadales bacterium]|nr:VCBS repeat-containing protein [Gemmatimonadales bacterium]
MPKGILNSVISASLLILSVSCSSAEKATFTRVTLETVGETNGGYVALADLNGDGKADLVAGLQWFEGPSWTRHPLHPTDANTPIDIGKAVPYDVDKDGDLDLVANRRPQELFWFENPGPPSTGTWTKHHITRKVKYPELLMFADIDGDGRDEMVGSDDGVGYGIRIYEIPDDPRKSSSWPWTTIDDSPLHGLGIGDLNQDGRLDLVSDFVWFQQTASGGWTKHSLPAPDEDNRGRLTMQINVSDVDGDGDQDVFLTRAHNYGAFWLESSGGPSPRFTLHEVLPGALPSQLHGVAYGDINGDGKVDVFAGACRYRHGDPGQKEPLDVFWLELVCKGGSVSWVKHQLATDLVMGFNPAIGDVDGDGDVDLVLRGLGLGGKYIIGTRQTDVIMFVQQGKGK